MGGIKMIFSIIILGIICLVISSYLYNLYVELIKLKNAVKSALSGIDVQLEKRYDLIPNILTIANKFMEHEKELITKITELRAQAVSVKSVEDKINLDSQITSKMGQLMVNMENYPQLKSDSTMLNAMQTYSEIEEHIAAARRFYNSAVTELNNKVEIFPSSMVASFLNISSYPFFVANPEAQKSVNASDYLYKK